MADHDRPLRHGDDVERRLHAGMPRDIDHDAELLHLLDDQPALDGQRHRRVEHAAAELVRELIGEIGGAQPQFVVLPQLGLRRVAAPPVVAVAISQPGTVLPADDHGDLAGALGGEDVVAGLGQHDLRVLVDELQHLREFRQVRHEVPDVGMRGEVLVDDIVQEIGPVGADHDDAGVLGEGGVPRDYPWAKPGRESESAAPAAPAWRKVRRSISRAPFTPTACGTSRFREGWPMAIYSLVGVVTGAGVVELLG